MWYANYVFNHNVMFHGTVGCTYKLGSDNRSKVENTTHMIGDHTAANRCLQYCCLCWDNPRRVGPCIIISLCPNLITCDWTPPQLIHHQLLLISEYTYAPLMKFFFSIMYSKNNRSTPTLSTQASIMNVREINSKALQLHEEIP